MKNKLLTKIDFTPSALREITIKIDAVKGINLGQGVCLMPVPEAVQEAALSAINAGKNRYCPAHGIPELRTAIAGKLNTFNRIPCNPENVIVTNGSSGAYEIICSACLEPGDEIILFSPFYPYHRNVAVRKGCTIKTVSLTPPQWTFDIVELEKAVTPKTKFIMLCNPGNPTGKVFKKTELEKIAEICNRHGVCCITDEVYEYLTYTGHHHTSMASLPDMFEKTLTMGSYSKTFSITGWRIGYLCASRSVISELTNMNDQIYVCAPTPFQYAAAHGIKTLTLDFYSDLLDAYERKRELTRQALENAELNPIVPQGAYYIMADTRKRFPGISAEAIADMMIEKSGVAAIPASEFLGPETKGNPGKSHFLRFSYSVPDEVIMEAGDRLKKL